MDIFALLLFMLNVLRADYGLDALPPDPCLNRYAQARAEAWFPEISHEGANPLYGENLVRVPIGEEDLEHAYEYLEASPVHLRNMIHPDVRSVAFGAVTDGRNLVISQVFSPYPPCEGP